MRSGKENSRRYYLHRQLKKVMRVQAHARQIIYMEGILDRMTDNQVRYFVELQLKYKYSAQLEISNE